MSDFEKIPPLVRYSYVEGIGHYPIFVMSGGRKALPEEFAGRITDDCPAWGIVHHDSEIVDDE